MFLQAPVAGQRSVQAVCKTHGVTEYRLRGKRYRCRLCGNEASTKSQRENNYAAAKAHQARMQTLIQEALGTSCTMCGYDRCFRALHAHHLDPSVKSITLARCSHIQQMKDELRKCILLCNNCHFAEEATLGWRHTAKCGLNSPARQPYLSGNCPTHGIGRFVLKTGSKSSYCAACSCEYIIERRHQVKDHLVACAGGSCRLCDYSQRIEALQFHHMKPETKAFGLSGTGLNKNQLALAAEFRKCLLVCGNCHHEIEDGLHDAVELERLYAQQHAEYGWRDQRFGKTYRYQLS